VQKDHLYLKKSVRHKWLGTGKVRKCNTSSDSSGVPFPRTLLLATLGVKITEIPNKNFIKNNVFPKMMLV